MNQVSENNGKLMRQMITLGVIGGVVYLLWKTKIVKKTIDSFQQKSTTKEMNELFNFLGPTFKKKIFIKPGTKPSGATYSYGDEQIADTFLAGTGGYHLYFFPYYTWNSETNPNFQIERVFKIAGDDGKKSTDTKFIGTWKLQGKKLTMNFLKYSEVSSWLNVTKAIKSGQGATFTGTNIKDILSKATGGQSITMDGLASRYKK